MNPTNYINTEFNTTVIIFLGTSNTCVQNQWYTATCTQAMHLGSRGENWVLRVDLNDATEEECQKE